MTTSPLSGVVLKEERFAVMIDGANLYQTARALGIDIDYKRLRDAFSSAGRLIRACYYTAIAGGEYSPVKPLVDWLDYNGFRVVTKPLKEFTDQAGRTKFKGNMDMEIAVDAMRMAKHLDHIVLFSGDGDFTRLVEALQDAGLRVTVVSTITSKPPMIADELRRMADTFLELKDLQPFIERSRSGGAPKQESDGE